MEQAPDLATQHAPENKRGELAAGAAMLTGLAAGTLTVSYSAARQAEALAGDAWANINPEISGETAENSSAPETVRQMANQTPSETVDWYGLASATAESLQGTAPAVGYAALAVALTGVGGRTIGIPIKRFLQSAKTSEFLDRHADLQAKKARKPDEGWLRWKFRRTKDKIAGLPAAWFDSHGPRVAHEFAEYEQAAQQEAATPVRRYRWATWEPEGAVYADEVGYSPEERGNTDVAFIDNAMAHYEPTWRDRVNGWGDRQLEKLARGVKALPGQIKHLATTRRRRHGEKIMKDLELQLALTQITSQTRISAAKFEPVKQDLASMTDSLSDLEARLDRAEVGVAQVNKRLTDQTAARLLADLDQPESQFAHA